MSRHHGTRGTFATALIASFALIAAACGGSSDDDNDERSIDTIEMAEQDISEADPPPEALVAATTTTSTTTTTTTTTTPPPTTTEPPTTTGGGSSGGGGGTATPNGNEVAFESGRTLTVGTDVIPGLYIAQAGGGFCSWVRVLADGTEEDNIYRGQVVLEIPASDQTFEPDADCGTWQPYAAPSETVSTIGEGHWVVGQQIVPGTYRTDQTEFDFCYWERSDGFTLTTDEIIRNNIVMEQTTVEILATDARFASSGCGTWTLVS